MALDLTRTVLQIDDMAESLRARRLDKRMRLESAYTAADAFDVDAYETKRAQPGAMPNWTLPIVPENPCVPYAPSPPPANYAVVGVDGSHIDVSRHLPARCYLINIGGIALRYGTPHAAAPFSAPRLYASDEELVIRDTLAPYREETINGALLDAKRAVEELQALADELRRISADVPALGLIDGSLIMFGMHRHPDFVVRQLIDEGFVKIMDDIRDMAQRRALAIASYISLPRSADLVNALRISVCPYPVANCDRECGTTRAGERPCDLKVGGVMDREIFDATLSVGERSPVFHSSAPIVRDHYGQHGVAFFYLKVAGTSAQTEEIGRVEIPDWVAADEALLETAHSLVVEQCRLGPGYPVALKEAHEQAVVTGADRQYFVELVETALTDNLLPVYSSEKNISKRFRWL